MPQPKKVKEEQRKEIPYGRCHTQPWGHGRKLEYTCGQKGEEQSNVDTNQKNHNSLLEYTARPSKARRHSCMNCKLKRPCTSFGPAEGVGWAELGWVVGLAVEWWEYREECSLRVARFNMIRWALTWYGRLVNLCFLFGLKTKNPIC